MAVNKVSFNTASGEEVLIDLTNDTVTPETLAEGVTAHGANGEPIVGTMRSGEDLDAVLAEQEELIAELKEVLTEKASGDGAEPVIEPLEITENGTYAAPDGVDGYSPVTVNVPVPDGYIKPSGELEVTENGTHDVTKYASVEVNVPTGGGGGDLPAGYSRVDYIQFNGSSWVDTGVIGTQDTQINAHFTWENSTQRHLFGCASSDNTASITSYMNGSWRFGNKSTSKSLGNKNPMLPYSALVNKTTISITNSITSISDVNDFETVGTLLLGGCRDADGTQPGVGITGKVYRFLLWQGDQLVRNLVPVTDGTVFRFYDTVSGAFFDSITSTPLSGGNL